MVRHKDSGEVQDVCNNGEYSCAFFVSSLLTLTSYLERPRATVAGLRASLLSLSLERVASVEDVWPGDIIFWEKIVFDNGQANEHVGFVITKSRAISTSFKKRMVVEHDIEMPGGMGEEKRKITLILRLPQTF
ncbi:MAG: hypothetical protein V4436_03850 [Patescibacteria group bacterium]